MKLALVDAGGGAAWVGLVDADGGTVTPVTAAVAVRQAQDALLDAAMARVDGPPPTTGDPVPIAGARLLAPVPEPPSIRDFFAFEEHVRTSRAGRGLPVPDDWYELPVFYFTNPAAVCGPGDEVAVPPGTAALDYELEVAAVVGVEVEGLADDDPGAMDVLAGFTIMNDWSARDLQMREMALMLGPAKGKDFATSLGPWLVTPDELPVATPGRPAGGMTARVNGERWSAGELGDIHHPWPRLLAHAARGTRLRPGDVIGSGTCGTGCVLELSTTHGFERYHWLVAGDEVELEVAGLGVLANRIVDRT